MPISTIGSNSLNQTSDLTINGQTVGKGGGNVATNTAHGVSALNATTGSSSNNSAFGSAAGSALTSGSRNTALGFNALLLNTTGNENTAVGGNSLNKSTTPSGNTALGYVSLYENTTGASNTAVGNSALQNNTTASNNTAVGYQAGYTNSTGQFNTFIGQQAGYTATGGLNTFVGVQSGYTVTTGTKNTIIGGYNGNQGSLDIRTGNNWIVFSDGDGNPRAWIGAGNNNDLFRVGTTDTSTSSFMHQIAYSQTSRAVLGVTNLVSGGNPSGITIAYPNSGDTSASNTYLSCSNNAGTRALIKNDGGINNYSANNTNLSDRREKKNFAPSKSYLDTVCAIPVQTFNYIDQDLENDPGLTLGVVAQDVQTVAPELITETNWGSKEEPKMRLSIYQTDLQYALMKSIQELKTIVDAQAAEIAELKAKVA